MDVTNYWMLGRDADLASVCDLQAVVL